MRQLARDTGVPMARHYDRAAAEYLARLAISTPTNTPKAATTTKSGSQRREHERMLYTHSPRRAQGTVEISQPRRQLDEPLTEELYAAWRRELRYKRAFRRAVGRIGRPLSCARGCARNARAPRRVGVRVVRRVTTTSSSADDPGGGCSDSDGPTRSHIAACRLPFEGSVVRCALDH